MELNQPFRLPAVLGSVTPAAKDEDHGVLSLQFGELSVFRGVVGQLIVGEESLWNGVRAHRKSSGGSVSAGYASAKSARAALAQSTSFCTAGAPLTPIAPTISPFTLMEKPPPYAATRASVGMPAKSDGSAWIKSKKSCVETPNKAVYALFCAISMVGIGAPSIRLKALRLPPSS